ncbi:MAG: DUF4097 family beta strand repeat protein [Pyrinomonadaceae bacterium]|nr:DUF4097 family beta strand repeat protein [Pyrinomonadaceae bacterium]
MAWLISLLMAGTFFAGGTASNVPVASVPQMTAVVKYDETERIEETYDFNSNGRIEVNNVNGSISIDTWDESKIKLEVIKTADSRERLADLSVEIDSKPERFRLTVDFGREKRNTKWDRGSKLTADIKMTVPKTAVLNEIHTVNGSVSILNSRNFTKASAVNGQVKAVNLQGNLDLSTVNGSIDAEFDELLAGNMISLDTVNGTVNLTIPSDSNATLRAETLNGEIKNDFGLPVKKGDWVGRDMFGKIGNGDAKIKIESVNGALSVKRRNDGRPLSPATNLLPPKDASRVESQFDNDFEAARREADRDFQNARRDLERARREMEASIRSSKINSESKEAIKASLEAMQPEIAKVTREALTQAEAALKIAELKANSDIVRKVMDTKAVVADARFQWRTPFMEEKTGAFAVKNTPLVNVETKNCDVIVRGWDKAEVKYSMSKFAANVSQPPVEFSANQADSSRIDIKVGNNNEPSGPLFFGPDVVRVQIEIYVPKKSNLTINTDSEVRIDGVTGKIDLTGEDGDINVRDSGGILDLKVHDSTVRVIGFKGQVHSASLDGNVFVEGDLEQLRATLADGTFVLTVPENIDADIVSNSSEVASEGIKLVDIPNSNPSQKRWRLGKGGKAYDFTVGDGNIVVRSRTALIASK